MAAYVYGLPPVSLRLTVARFPLNQLVSVAKLADPSTRTVVAPNNDTAYSVSRLDLSSGPLVIDVPDTRGRYYVLQLMDAYTNVFGYVGRRTTGTKRGSFAILPPRFRGALPTGLRSIRSPTRLVWLLGRTLVDGPADIPAAKAVMAGYSLTPLTVWASGRRNTPIVLDDFPPRLARLVVPKGLAFYDALGENLREDPPPRRDRCALRAFAAVGIGRGRRPSAEIGSPLLRGALRAATHSGSRLIDRAVDRADRYSRRRNRGWLLPGAYVGRFGRNYLARAVVTRVGLGANTREEALYPIAFRDSKGRRLTGRHRYVVRFRRRELPPVRAFWSLTVYDREGFLVRNPIDRYSVGDRTRGLHRGRGGSLTLYVQHSAPAGRRRSNWLPAPRGRFRLMLRLYEPRRSALTGRWRPPPVRRVRTAP